MSSRRELEEDQRELRQQIGMVEKMVRLKRSPDGDVLNHILNDRLEDSKDRLIDAHTRDETDRYKGRCEELRDLLELMEMSEVNLNALRQADEILQQEILDFSRIPTDDSGALE